MYEIISERVTSVTTDEASEPIPAAGLPAPRSSMTIGDFEARIRRYNSDLQADSVTFKAAVILLAGLEFGHNIDRIARRTGFDRAFVARVARRLTDNGVWNAGVTVADWSSSDEASGTFWNDVAVAEGKMCRRIGNTGQIEWAPAGFWNKNFQYVAQTHDPELSTQYDDPKLGVDNSIDVDNSIVGKSATDRDDAFLIGDDADADDSDDGIGLRKVGLEHVETEIIGPLAGTPLALPVASPGTVVPALGDLFRDVVWIG